MSDTTERAASRRRWISVGETIAVAGLVISALGLYNGWGRSDPAPAPTAASPARIAALLLKGTADKEGDRIAIEATNPAVTIQTQVLTLPAALGVPPVENTGTPEIAADWLGKGLVKARRAAGRSGEAARQELLPIVIATRYIDGDVVRDARGLYDVAYTIETSFLGGSRVRLHGISLRRSRLTGSGQADIDTLWAARNPTRK